VLTLALLPKLQRQVGGSMNVWCWSTCLLLFHSLALLSTLACAVDAIPIGSPSSMTVTRLLNAGLPFTNRRGSQQSTHLPGARQIARNDALLSLSSVHILVAELSKCAAERVQRTTI